MQHFSYFTLMRSTFMWEKVACNILHKEIVFFFFFNGKVWERERSRTIEVREVTNTWGWIMRVNRELSGWLFYQCYKVGSWLFVSQKLSWIRQSDESKWTLTFVTNPHSTSPLNSVNNWQNIKNNILTSRKPARCAEYVIIL